MNTARKKSERFVTLFTFLALFLPPLHRLSMENPINGQYSAFNNLMGDLNVEHLCSLHRESFCRYSFLNGLLFVNALIE